MKVRKARSRPKTGGHDLRGLAIPLSLLAVVVILSVYILANDVTLPEFVPLPDMSTEGYSEVVIGVNITETRGYVSMDGGCYDLTVEIDRNQAISIFNGINGLIGERPNTHDLMKDLMENLDARLLMVKVDDVKNGTFYGKMIIRERNLVINLDTRPSDALALAARTSYQVPVYVRNDILATGTKFC
jgi:bifunctional DNase/RNase